MTSAMLKRARNGIHFVPQQCVPGIIIGRSLSAVEPEMQYISLTKEALAAHAAADFADSVSEFFGS
jgi:hypothetical protein